MFGNSTQSFRLAKETRNSGDFYMYKITYIHTHTYTHIYLPHIHMIVYSELNNITQEQNLERHSPGKCSAAREKQVHQFLGQEMRQKGKMPQ